LRRPALVTRANVNSKPPSEETFRALGESLSRCTLPLLVMHKGYPTSFGTGFLLKHLSVHYLVSAAHVFNRASSMHLRLFFYTEPDKTRFVTGGYNATTSLPGRQQTDTWDVGVIRLDGDLPPYDSGKTDSLQIELLKPGLLPRQGVAYYATGYPASKGGANRVAKTIRSMVLVYSAPSSPPEIYQQLRLSPRSNIVMPFHARKSLDEKMNSAQQMPDPYGMSGGPLWIVEQLAMGYLLPQIVGVLIEHRPNKVMIATDVGIVHSLIRGIEQKRQEDGMQLDDFVMEHWPGRHTRPDRQ
jgi:hypothetical protein